MRTLKTRKRLGLKIHQDVFVANIRADRANLFWGHRPAGSCIHPIVVWESAILFSEQVFRPAIRLADVKNPKNLAVIELGQALRVANPRRGICRGLRKFHVDHGLGDLNPQTRFTILVERQAT